MKEWLIAGVKEGNSQIHAGKTVSLPEKFPELLFKKKKKLYSKILIF